MGVLPVCVSAHFVPAWCPRGPEEDARFSGTGVKDGCKLPCVGAGN